MAGKLKTLKDLEFKLVLNLDKKEPHLPKDFEDVVKVNKLRREAIKWIKAMSNKNDKGVKNLRTVEKELLNVFWEGQVQWVKNFFNITEEDLQ